MRRGVPVSVASQPGLQEPKSNKHASSIGKTHDTNQHDKAHYLSSHQLLTESVCEHVCMYVGRKREGAQGPLISYFCQILVGR